MRVHVSCSCPPQVDRSGAYIVRQVAKSIVASGLARRVIVQVLLPASTLHTAVVGVCTLYQPMTDRPIIHHRPAAALSLQQGVTRRSSCAGVVRHRRGAAAVSARGHVRDRQDP